MKVGAVCLLLVLLSSSCFAMGQCTEQVDGYLSGKMLGIRINPESTDIPQAKKDIKRVEDLRTRGYSDCDIVAQIPAIRHSKNDAVKQTVEFSKKVGTKFMSLFKKQPE